MKRDSALDALRAFDEEEGPLRWQGEDVPELTTRAYNRVKASYALYAEAKRKSWFKGTITREHGLPPEEAAVLAHVRAWGRGSWSHAT